MRRFILFFFQLACLQLAFGQDFLDEGLYFSSHEVNQEKRTSLNLTPNNPIRLKDKFNISFEANFRRGDGYYGNILKIIGDEFLNIDLVANLDDIDENFWLVLKDKVLFKYKWSDIPKGNYDKWIKFNIEIDIKNSKISISINDEKIVKTSNELLNISDFEIMFGRSLYNNFSTTDVCPMSIKNIKILNEKGKLIRNWSLGKHTTNDIVYDNIVNDAAIAENPKWLIDQHLFWKKNKDFDFNGLQGTAKDEESERIFFISSKAIHVYSIKNDELKVFIINENSLQCQSNNFIFNKFTKELIAYSIDERTYNVFDFDNLKWLNSESSCKETSYLHHNKMIVPRDSSLFTFGGYGYYNYKSSINRFDSKSSEFKSFDIGNQIPPRYLSSSGILNSDKFLIFGGYGSISGKQGVNSQFYYDLYSVEFEGLKFTKLWTIDNVSSKPYVPVQSMVIDHKSESLYALVYNNTVYKTDLKLVRFGINEPETTVFPDSISYKFLDVKSDADFFLNKSKSQLYTITTLDDKASLFSLTYPPLLAEEVYQEEIIGNNFYWYYWVFIFIGVLLLFLLAFRRLKASKAQSIEKAIIKENSIEPNNSKKEKIKKSAIYLFGGFHVYDKEGQNITALFTPTLKELFLLILLSSEKDDEGISSIKLTELLWPNKSESNARNNRNVNISKLRILLEKIGDIEISNDNTYWLMHIGSSIFCDYSHVTNILSQSTNNDFGEEEIYELLNIISRGKISPDLQTEWIETLKTDISNLIIDGLNSISKNQNDLRLLILISNTILKYGPLNEEAISLKCKSLYGLGKKGASKQSYNQFCEEYFEILDAKYDKSFKEVIK